MATISHRELRDNAGEVLRAAAAGETITVTNRGADVARVVPLQSARAQPIRPSTHSGGFTRMGRAVISECTGEVLDELRGGG